METITSNLKTQGLEITLLKPLSYFRNEDHESSVRVYHNGEYLGTTLIYWDNEQNEREYLDINNEVIYLDTIEEIVD